MDQLTRRTALRLAGGAGAAGLAGATLALQPAEAGTGLRKRVRASLDKKVYRPGERMVLTVRDNLAPGRKLAVHDTSGRVWRRVGKTRHRWESTAGKQAAGSVTVAAVWPDGRVVHNRRFRFTVHYQVASQGSLVVGGTALIGMSAPVGEWSDRVGEVGSGLAARRIFADLAAGPDNQIDLVESAHAAGMLPVVSYKVGGDIAGAVKGQYNAAAEAAATRLASYGLPTAVTFWHEPNPDISGADYAAASRQLLPIFKRDELRVGPLLNGWLLDKQVDTLASYTPDDLFALWDWFGMDTYESGTAENPGAAKPADRVPALKQFMNARGFDLPLGVGEYNGYSGATIAACGEALLSTPNVWFGCVWNTTGGKGLVLTGDRLAAFQSTLADPRSATPRTA